MPCICNNYVYYVQTACYMHLYASDYHYRNMLAICTYMRSMCINMQAEMRMLYAEKCKCAYCMQTL